jgi:peptidoglycan/LPS O-acetylase OafA/YrhL
MEGSIFRADDLAPAQARATHYIAGLDGLRAISILLVMLSHAGLGHIVPGGLGVTIFFAISGFLITTQIKDEIGRTGGLDLRRFYLRRALRLAPALLVYIAIMTPLAMLLGAAIAPADVLASLFYVANYWWLYTGYPAGSPFPILWSLSIEEQYYILFPIIMALWLPKPQKLVWPILTLVALALAWRFTLATSCGTHAASYLLCGPPPRPDMPDGARIYLATDTRFDCILAGALMALLATSDRWRTTLASQQAVGIALALLLTALTIRNPLFRDTLRYTIESAASGIIVLHIAHAAHSQLRNALAFAPLVHIGKLSYSLYLYHFAARLVISRVHGSFDWKNFAFYVFFALSFLLATASYRLVERPMLRLRRRFGAHAT